MIQMHLPLGAFGFDADVAFGEALQFIEQWHYSGIMPTGKNICYGWRLEDGTLYAVAVYGIGANPHQAQYLARVTGRPVTIDKLVELRRLARIEPKQHSVPLTKFLSRCHRQLRSERIARFVVSFSDPAHHHNGGIYAAASFKHLGKTAPERHDISSDGELFHRRRAYRLAKRKGVSIGNAKEILGFTSIRTLPKDRWFKEI